MWTLHSSLRTIEINEVLSLVSLETGTKPSFGNFKSVLQLWANAQGIWFLMHYKLELPNDHLRRSLSFMYNLLCLHQWNQFKAQMQRKYTGVEVKTTREYTIVNAQNILSFYSSSNGNLQKIEESTINKYCLLSAGFEKLRNLEK